MYSNITRKGIEVFSTCPQSVEAQGNAYIKKVHDVAKWSEQYGCTGILVYTDNRLVDPWLVSQIIIQSTEQLCPLVAIQPIYMHPYSIAKMVSSISHLYERRLYLNMLAGGFRNDLLALNDPTPHDKRYERMVEYTTIIKNLLQSQDAVTFGGEWYTISSLKLNPPISPELMPGIFVSGSSAAGQAAAHALGATAVHYPKPSSEYSGKAEEALLDSGIRIGIIAREREADAWDTAHKRFPADRKGQLTRQLANKVSDSSWHKQLADLTEKTKDAQSPYWLVPFENYNTNCPYLVGTHRQVADELTCYLKAGHKKFILDIPPSEEELHHSAITFEYAAQEMA